MAEDASAQISNSKKSQAFGGLNSGAVNAVFAIIGRAVGSASLRGKNGWTSSIAATSAKWHHGVQRHELIAFECGAACPFVA
jgi:hypothetical protein